MYNWSVDEKNMAGEGEEQTIWRIQQMANFGLNKQKIPEADLRKYWDKIKIDPARKKFLYILLYGDGSPHAAAN